MENKNQQRPETAPPAVSHYATWKMNTSETRLVVARKMILQEKPGALLDVACSAGEFSRTFMSLGWKVFGIDHQPEKLVEARQAGLETKDCDIGHESFPFPDASFDCVFGGEIIEHVVDTDAFLREIYRVLKPAGAMILTTPNLLSFENRIRMLFGFYPRWVDYHCTRLGHVRPYSFPTLKNQVTENGFAVEYAKGNYVPLCNNQFLFLDDRKLHFVRFTGMLFPTLSGTIILKARKV